MQLIAIGFESDVEYGGLSEWATTFQMDNDAAGGWWWGHTAHSKSEGAMALDTDGNLTIARGLRISSESDATGPPNRYINDSSGGCCNSR